MPSWGTDLSIFMCSEIFKVCVGGGGGGRGKAGGWGGLEGGGGGWDGGRGVGDGGAIFVFFAIFCFLRFCFEI